MITVSTAISPHRRGDRDAFIVSSRSVQKRTWRGVAGIRRGGANPEALRGRRYTEGFAGHGRGSFKTGRQNGGPIPEQYRRESNDSTGNTGDVLKIQTGERRGVHEGMEKGKSPNMVSHASQTSTAEQPSNTEFYAHEEARAKLIANLAHDLRTPLVAVRGYTRMILDDRAGPINGTQREYLTIVAENTNRVIQLLNTLLQLTSQQSMRFEAFDARELWTEILSILRPRALAGSVRITEHFAQAPLKIFGDRTKLQGVFTDLLANAVKFTDPGGQVVVELSGNQEGEVAVTISDSGVGIPEEILERIISRENRSEPVMGSFRESLGVGLSVIQDILRLHGGKISVSSNADRGVTFAIILPAV
jgi:signal transduction histidine kinase